MDNILKVSSFYNKCASILLHDNFITSNNIGESER